MAHSAAVERRPRDRLARCAGGWTLTVGAVVLLGWGVLASPLTQVVPGLPAMAPLSALGFLLAGVALLALTPAPLGRAPGGRRQWTGRAAGLAAALIGGAALVEHLFRRSLGIDLLLFGDAVRAAEPELSGRPAVHVAAVLLAAGSALAVLDADARRGHRAANVLMPVAVMTALATILGYVYRVVYQWGSDAPGTPVTGMAVHEVPTLLMLAIGLLLARPDRPLVRALASPGVGGMMYRRLTPALLLVPFVIGLWQAAGAHGGVRAGTLGITVTTVVTILLLLAVVSRTVRTLDRAEEVQLGLMARLREERDFSTTLLHSLQDGVVVVDLNQRVVDVNPRWCEMSGFSRRELIGLAPPYPWRRPADAARFGAVNTEMLDGHTRGEMERDYRRADGSDLPVLVTVTPVNGADGRPRAFVAMYKDIAERRRVVEELAAYTEQLELANHQLASANQFKTDLMGMLSHEIGQPLTSITTFAGLVTSQWEQLSDAERLDDVRRIEAGARRLFQLVGELTLMFRLDAHTILAGRVPVEVNDAVRQVVATLAASVDVRTHEGPPLYALVDSGHLQQVLVNLLTNATKYGAEPIEMSVARVGDRVEIRVRDHGKGVPAEFVPRLFERFTRAGNGAATKVAGSGLGLFIVRQLAGASGGTIRHEPASPGSCFVVDLEGTAEAPVEPAAGRVTTGARGRPG
jgi:PAS domain S-box-containing protein